MKRTYPRAVCFFVFLLAILLLLYFKIAKNQILAASGFTVAILILAIASSIKRSNRLLALSLSLSAAYLFIFLQNLVDIRALSVPRLLPVGIILITAGLFLCALLTAFHISSYPKSLVIGLCVAGVIFLWEGVLEILPHPSVPVQWIGGLKRDPVLGWAPIPHSEMRTLYPNNPRGYFDRLSFTSQWRLRAGDGSSARISFFKEGDRAQIQIGKIAGKAPYDVQLNIPYLSVYSHEKYIVSFGARSDSARTIRVGFSRDHDPWNGLGLYREIALTDQWKTFDIPFRATATDDNARINFDLGDSAAGVDLSAPRLRDASDGKIINPVIPPPAYEIRYRLNDHGCRGRDYAIPKPAGRNRLLVLGSSSAFGIGVREEDTFPAQLEKILNQGMQKYEVVNCGVPGYTPLEDRLLYESGLGVYDPDMVLVVLPHFFEDMSQRYYSSPPPPSRLKQLFFSWSETPAYPQQYLTLDTNLALEEIAKLHEKLTATDVKLAVVFTRMDTDYSGHTEMGKSWNAATAKLEEFVRQNNIPLFDTGRAFRDHRSLKTLVVDPQIDQHPNEKAYKIFAQEIAGYLMPK